MIKQLSKLSMLQRYFLMLVMFVLVFKLSALFFLTFIDKKYTVSRVHLYNNLSGTNNFLNICRKLTTLPIDSLRVMTHSKLPQFGVRNRFQCENVWSLWKETDSNFKQVNDVPDLFVYSAYFDDRTSNPAFVRVSLYRNLSTPTNLTCKFIIHANSEKLDIYTVKAVNSQQELGKNKNKTNSSWFANCPIPVNINPERVCHIAISTKPSILDLSIMRKIKDAILPVRSTKQIRNGRKFTRGLCVRASHNTNTIDPVKLTEFLMVNRQLGVDLIRIYVEEKLVDRITATFSSFMNNKYCIQHINETSSGEDFCLFLDLVEYKLPKDKAYTFAQNILEFDCLYRSMSQVKYLTYHDLDEVIIPSTRFCSVNDLLLKLDIRLEEFSGVCFKNVWFPEKLVQRKDSILYYFADSHYAKLPLANITHKCIINPRLITDFHANTPFIDIQGKRAIYKLVKPDKYGMAGHFRSINRNGYYTYNSNTHFEIMNNLQQFIPTDWRNLVKQRLMMSGLLCD